MKYKNVSVVTKNTHKIGVKILNNRLEKFFVSEFAYIISYIKNGYSQFYSIESPTEQQLKNILPKFHNFTWDYEYKKKIQSSNSIKILSEIILKEHRALQDLIGLQINLSYEKISSFYSKIDSTGTCNQSHHLSTLISANLSDFSQYSILTNAKIHSGLAKTISVDLQPFQFVEWSHNLPLLFTSKAASKILHAFLRYFYVDTLAMGETFVKDYSIGDSLLSPNITIKITPYTGISFDLYGDSCEDQVIIHNGILRGHIGSKLYSSLTSNANIGYSDLQNHEKISHQNVFVDIGNCVRVNSNAVKIIDFEMSSARPSGYIAGTIKYISPTEKNKLFSSLYSFNIVDFLNNVAAAGKPLWTNNVLIPNLYYTPPLLPPLYLP